jgi:hypothetical protein
MLASLQTKSMNQNEQTRKRPAPITVPVAAKKRRGLVSRTHSPKRQVKFISHTKLLRVQVLPPAPCHILTTLTFLLISFSCCHYLFQVSPVSTPFLEKPSVTTASTPLERQKKYDVRKLSPTVKGVTEAARLICSGETVVVPTETVYMTCSSLFSLHGASTRPENSRKSSVVCLFFLLSSARK